MKKRAFILMVAISMLCISAFSFVAAEDANEKSGSLPDNKIPVTESNVRFLGRTYQHRATKFYYFNWTAAGFEFTFEGTTAMAELHTNPTSEPKNLPQIYVFVDGKDEPSEGKLITVQPGRNYYVLAENLPQGVHTIKVIKKTSNFTFGDPITGVVGVKTLNLPGGKLLDPPKPKALQLEFFGDSITVGSGIEIDREDGWRTYAAYAARKLDADMNVIAIPGMGLICSLFGDKFIEIPDEFPYADKANMANLLWDHSKYQTDVAVINLGTNDIAGVGPGKKFSFQDYEDGYFNFIMEIKSKYPKCKVIGAIGAMGRKELLPYIENATRRANEAVGEEFAYPLEFSEYIAPAGADPHPSAEKHEELGEELLALINEIVDWDSIYEDEEPVETGTDEEPTETTEPQTPGETPGETPVDESPVDESPVDEPTASPSPAETETDAPAETPAATDEDPDSPGTEAPPTGDNGTWLYMMGMIIALGAVTAKGCKALFKAKSKFD